MYSRQMVIYPEKENFWNSMVFFTNLTKISLKWYSTSIHVLNVTDLHLLFVGKLWKKKYWHLPITKPSRRKKKDCRSVLHVSVFSDHMSHVMLDYTCTKAVAQHENHMIQTNDKGNAVICISHWPAGGNY